MLRTILAVSVDLADRKHSTSAWKQHGYDVLWADTMCDAIKLLSNSKKYLFIGINEDNIDYWEQLPTMRKTTDTPIYIITSTFSIEKKVKALRLGADGYDPFADNLEENVGGALALLEAQGRAIAQAGSPIEKMIHGNILLLPSQREVFIGISEVILNK
ncbi:MAG: hypothetical protein LBD23_09170, partial [Oscillospiraceae bacterium]|nr:hypothetical protein [Oscillospiraceae bacterium]